MNQQERDTERAEKVDALLKQAAALGITTTRRQGRKALSNRGSLRRLIAEAEAARQAQP